jgi:hypothetical protein
MPSHAPTNRFRFLVDCEVQSAILFRVGIYGCATTLYFVITLICTQCLSDPERGLMDSLSKCLEDVVYWLPGFLFLVPVATHDLLKMTNHFAGPIHRLRREMQLLAEDKSERPLAFRDEDYWNDVSIAYNQLRGELLRLRKRVAELDVATEPLPPSLLDETAMNDDFDGLNQFGEPDAIDRLQELIAAGNPSSPAPV